MRVFFKRCNLGAIGAVVIVLLMTQLTYAAGFAIQEKSVTALGRAYAGNSLPGDDASAAIYNPADMVNLNKSTQMQLGLVYVSTDIDVGGAYDTGALTCTTCSGSANSNESGWIPNFNLVHQINEHVSAGLSINAPFGLSTDYGENWFGRYSSTLSELEVIDINPSVAFALNERLSVGFGLSYQYISAGLNQKLHPGALAGALLQSGDITLGQVPAFTSATEGDAGLEGDDWSWGYNLGFTWKVTDAVTTSIAYRSEVSHVIDGDQVVSGYTAGGALASTLNTSTGGESDIVMPELLNISALFELNDQWSFMTSFIYTGWSSFDELRVELENGTTTVQPQKWDSVWAFGIGAEYAYSDKLDLRFGFQFDPSPALSTKERSAQIPDGDRDLYCLGFSWHLNENMTVDGAYAYNRGESVDLGAGGYAGSQGTFNAEVEKSVAHLVGVQLQYYM